MDEREDPRGKREKKFFKPGKGPFEGIRGKKRKGGWEKCLIKKLPPRIAGWRGR